MKAFFIHLLPLLFSLVSMSCAQQEEPSDIESNLCQSHEILEELKDQKAKVVKFYDIGFILTTNQNDFDRDFFVHATNKDILVPIVWNYSFEDNAIVIISGKKYSCCGLLSFPNERRVFGCKFKITSIKLQTDSI